MYSPWGRPAGDPRHSPYDDSDVDCSHQAGRPGSAAERRPGRGTTARQAKAPHTDGAALTWPPGQTAPTPSRTGAAATLDLPGHSGPQPPRETCWCRTRQRSRLFQSHEKGARPGQMPGRRLPGPGLGRESKFGLTPDFPTRCPPVAKTPSTLAAHRERLPLHVACDINYQAMRAAAWPGAHPAPRSREAPFP